MVKDDIILCFPYMSPEGSTVYNEADSTNEIELFEHCLLPISLP